MHQINQTIEKIVGRIQDEVLRLDSKGNHLFSKSRICLSEKR